MSTIVPAYDYADWLPAALDSALAQDWPADRHEIVVVDDGSTDGTPAVVAGYEARFPGRVRGVRQANGGLNAATGRGMAEARGELLTLLDADDEWPAGRLRALSAPLLGDPRVGLTWGDMEVVDPAGRTLHPSFRAGNGIVPDAEPLPGRLLRGNVVSAGSLMVRAALRDRFLPYPPFASWNDWWIVWRVAEVAGVVAVPDVVNRYRLHDANMNLGADAARLATLQAGEVPFRRWLLAEPAPAGVTPRQRVAGLHALWGVLARVADAQGPAAAQALAPDPATLRAGRDRRMAAEAALGAGRAGDGLAHLVAALACGEERPDDGALLDEVLELAEAEAAGAAGRHETRRQVLLADLRALARDPAPLVRWAAATGADDPVTLVVGGVRGDADTATVVALAEHAGVSESGADVLALPQRHREAVAAVLGRPVDRLLA